LNSIEQQHDYPHSLERVGLSGHYWCGNCYGRVSAYQIKVGLWRSIIGEQCPAMMLKDE